MIADIFAKPNIEAAYVDAVTRLQDDEGTQQMKRRLDTIQALRAFAATVVLFHHSVEAVYRGPAPASKASGIFREVASMGAFGVDIFFVVSGFIMVYAHADDFAASGAQSRFLTNRIRRLVPNYWLLTSVAVLTLVIAPGLSHYGRTADWQWVLASYLFVPWTSEAGIGLPVLGLGWTLNYEMYFYVLFSFALLFSRWVGLLLLGLAIAVSILLGAIFAPTTPFLVQATNWLLLEFFVGALLGLAFIKGMSIPFRPAVFLLLTTAALVAVSMVFRENGTLTQFQRFVFYGVPAAALVATAALSEKIRALRVPGWLLLVGAASYSLYLTHLFSLPLTQRALAYFWIGLDPFIEILLLLTVSILVSILFYQLFERPTQRLLRKPKTGHSA